MSTPEQLYRGLAQIFSDRQNNVLEIEILLPEFSPLLHDGHAIGITKKALVQAFIVARNIFFDSLAQKTGKDDKVSSTALPTVEEKTAQIAEPSGVANEDERVSVATEIMLLFDCEHLTACNWRKRRIAAALVQSGNHAAASTMPGTKRREEKLVQLLETERSLMTTYLCSPLHRHTKSPTLWQHRLWVMSRLTEIQQRQQLDEQQPRKSRLDAMRRILGAELSVALRAGEQHPKNYYAFSYMRQLHSVLSRTLEGGSQDRAGEEPLSFFSELAGCLVDSTLTWCLAHPRDISGWMFLLYLLEASTIKHVQRNAVRKVVQFALDVGWEGESLWTFVDLATRKFDVEIDFWKEKSNLVDSSREERVVNGIVLPEKRWRIWVARAKTIWATDGHSGENSAIFLSAEKG